MSDEILALNELTGLVHKYKGTELKPDGIGLITCDCEDFEDAAEHSSLTAINREHLERGIWKPAPCLQDDQ